MACKIPEKKLTCERKEVLYKSDWAGDLVRGDALVCVLSEHLKKRGVKFEQPYYSGGPGISICIEDFKKASKILRNIIENPVKSGYEQKIKEIRNSI